jgi:vitamin B12 transporter
MHRKLNRLKALPVFITGICCYSVAFAQTDTVKKLKEVKVHTSPMPKVQMLAPAQQISAADFEHYNAFNVADAIRDFSGVNVKDYGGIGGLKTISVRGLGANHTAVLYDGVQLNDAENGQIDLSKFNLQNVQEITLYNGQPPNICQPARTFSAASVLSIKTVKPSLPANKPYLITAGVKTGSFGLFNPFLQWQQRISTTWSLIINSYIENADGRYKYKAQNDGVDSLRTRTGADLTSQQIDGALYWTKSDSNKFSLHVNYYNSDRGLPGAVILYSTAQPSRLWNQDFFLQASYEHIWHNRLHLLLNGKVSKDYLHYFTPFLNTQGDLDQHFTQREAYISAALSYTILSNWEVSYAVDGSLNDLNTQYNFTPATPFPIPTRFTLLNVLASNYTIGKLHLQGSLLNTNTVESVKIGKPAPNRNIYSPTLMASIQPFDSSNFQLRGFYKNIFRDLTFNDLYYEPVINPNLKPEFVKEFDLGATYTKGLTGFFNYVTFTIDAYYNNVTNKIVFIPHDPFNASVTNAGKVDVKGIDVSIKTQINLSSELKGALSANYTFQNAINVTDPTSSIFLNQIPYTPKNTSALNAGLNYGHLGVYFNQVLLSQRYFTNDNLPGDNLPGYSISDASVFYHFFTGNRIPLKASFEVNNLFNKSYYVIQSYPMPGRSYRISLQITI